MEPIIKLEGVNFFYEQGKSVEVHALRDINLDIRKGEFISFFGPSGCGKSTLLYMISGIEKPHKGRVLVNGHDISMLSPKEIAVFRQVGIGLIFQNFNLIPSISVMENVTLPMAFLGISLELRRKRATELLERLGLAEFANRYPFELSGGQQQRVGIARALANDPPIILADEPTGNLDSANATKTMELLREFNQKEKKTVILVTHEAWSLRYVGKIFYMRDGVITKVEEHKIPDHIEAKPTSENYKELFPELSDIETSARTFAQLVLRGYSEAEISRLEQLLGKRFGNKITSAEFKRMLDISYDEGGVGLWKQKAESIGAFVDQLMKEEKELYKLYRKLEKNPSAPLYEEVERIRAWLMEDFSVKLTSLQVDRLHKLIEERIKNSIDAARFRESLDTSKGDGGVGLRKRTSFKMSDKLEMILKTSAAATKKEGKKEDKKEADGAPEAEAH